MTFVKRARASTYDLLRYTRLNFYYYPVKGIQILKRYLQVWFVAFSEREFMVISGLSTVVEAIGRFPILIFLSLSLNRFSWEAIPS